MRRLISQATGTSTSARHRIEISVGTSTEPLARMMPASAEPMPKITVLHSITCSSVCAISITSGRVMNRPISGRENR